MADAKTAPEELEDDGTPIPKVGEGGGAPPKIESKTEEEGAEPDEVVPVRKSVLQHVIARKNRQLERLRSKDDEDDEGAEPPKGGKDEEDEDDSLTPEARGAVQREVQRQIGPVVKSFASKADEDELGDLLANEPESAKYEKRIRAYMGNSHYKGVPPSVIYHHLAFDAAAGTGVRRKQAANLDANQQRGGGRTTRPVVTGTGDVPSIEEQNDMSDADFEILQNRALSGDFAEKREG